MKKLNFIKKFFIATLAGALIMQTLPAAPLLTEVMAEEGYEDIDGPVDMDDAGWLQTSRGTIDFGERDKGEAVTYEGLSVGNYGVQNHDLSWSISGDAGAFLIEAPSSMFLAPGGICEFHIAPNTSAEPGEHIATLSISGSSISGYSETRSCALYMTIKKAAPYVTSVTVYPGSTEATTGAFLHFDSHVEGGNGANLGVTWSVAGAVAVNTVIDSAGNLAIAKNESARELTVVAQSNQNPNIKGYAKVYVREDEKYTLSVSANPAAGGYVTGGGTVGRGENLTVYASPNNGYRFAGWYNGNTKVCADAAYTVTNINKNIALVATFSKNEVRVNVKKNNSGAGSVTDTATINYGSNMTLRATANSGFVFKEWREGDRVLSNSTVYELQNVTSNRDITAVFEQIDFKLAVSAYPNYSGVTTGTGVYRKGTNITVTAAPVAGYVFSCWTINGDIVSKDAKFTLKGIDKDISLVAVFTDPKANKFTITSAASAGGSISPAGSVQIQGGTSVIYKMTPKSGYRISNVAVDNVLVGAVNSYTFSNVNANHTIAVAFEKKETISQKKEGSGTTTEKQEVTIDTTPSKTETKPVAKPEPVPEVEDISTDLPIDNEVIDEVHEAETTVEPDVQNIMSIMGRSMNEIADIIRSGDDQDFMYAALQTGNLKVTFSNDYSKDYQETSDKGYYELNNAPNFAEVVDTLLTTEDKLDMLVGAHYGVNLNIANVTENIPLATQRLLDKNKEDDIVISDILDIIMMKDANGYTELVKTLPKPLTVVLDVPDYLLDEGIDEFYILRLHREDDGTQVFTELRDEDNDPTTITFTTDCFSTYAVAYRSNANVAREGGTRSAAIAGNINRVLLAVIMILNVIVLVFLVLIIVQIVKRNKRRKNAK